MINGDDKRNQLLFELLLRIINMSGLTGYYSQIHFQIGSDLELFYNLPVINEPGSDKRFDPCPYVEKLYCSRAEELAPDLCISERKCEIYFNKDNLFQPLGISGSVLKKIDEELRNKK